MWRQQGQSHGRQVRRQQVDRKRRVMHGIAWHDAELKPRRAQLAGFKPFGGTLKNIRRRADANTASQLIPYNGHLALSEIGSAS